MSPTSIFSAILAACLTLPATAGAQAFSNLPDWMAGRWCSASPNGNTQEVWLAPAGGLMVGMSRTVSKTRPRAQFEFLRIELRDGVPTYLAQPQGRAPVEFKQVHADQGRARFENLAHDFPKRIEYRRTGDALHAEISGPGRDGKQFAIAFPYVACTEETKRP